MSSKHNIMLDERSMAFLLNDALEISIDDLCNYIKENWTGIDFCTIRKKYTHLAMNGRELNHILSAYLLNKIYSLEDFNNNNDYDYEHLVNENIDIFFDVTESSDDIMIIELAKHD